MESETQAQEISQPLPHELKIAKEASIAMGGNLIGGVLRYLFNVILARMAGVEVLGTYALGIAMTATAAVVGKLGLDGGVLRYVARYRALGDDHQVRATIQRGLKVGLSSSVIVMTILLLAAGAISKSVFMAEGTRFPELLRLFTLAIPLMITAQILTGASQGFQVLKHHALALQVLPTGALVLLFPIFATWMEPYTAIGFVFIGSQLISLLAAAYFLHSLFPFHQPAGAKLEAHLVRFSLPLVMAALIAELMYRSDIIMLGALIDYRTAGLYQPAVRTAGIMVLLVASFSGIFAPIISDLHAQDKLERIHELLKLVSRWSFAITWPAFLFLLLYAPRVMLVFGGDFLPGRDALRLLAAIQVIASLGMGCAIVFGMTGYPRINLLNNLAAMIVNIAANLYFIPRYGLIGAAWGTGTALGLLSLVRFIEVWWMYRMTPFSWKHAKPLLAGIMAWLVCSLANHVVLQWHTVLVLLTAGILFVGVYAGMLLILGIDPADREVISAVGRKLKRGLL